MDHTSPLHRPACGFTLIELMIVLAVLAVLALIAVPQYQESTRKSRRMEAVAALTQVQQAQERHRAGNTTYAADFAAFAASAAVPSSTPNYNIAIDAAGPSSYQVTASAKAGSSQYADTACRGLRVRAASGVLIYESLDAANAVDSANANRCWAR